MGIVGLEVEVVDDEPRDGGLAACGRLDLLDLGADHHPRKRGGRLELRIAGRYLPAPAQDGGGVAQALHFLQLVADIEDGSALRFEAVEYDEELVGFLRRQHCRRLVKD